MLNPNSWLSLLIMLFGGTFFSSRAGSFEKGSPFPTLVLPDLNGQPSSITVFQGKKTVLHLFASW